MDIGLLEFGRTNFIGALLLVGLYLLLRLPTKRELSQVGKPGWFPTILFVVSTYGLGLIVEDVSEALLDDWWLLSEERIRAEALFRPSGDECARSRRALGDKYVFDKVRPLAKEFGFAIAYALDRGWRRDLSDTSSRFSSFLKQRELTFHSRELDSVVEPLYFAAKSSVYREPNYFTELEEIDARARFARSVAATAALLCVVLLVRIPLHLCCRRSSPLRLDPLRPWSPLVVTLFFVLIATLVAALLAHVHEEREQTVRVFGYFIELNSRPVSP